MAFFTNNFIAGTGLPRTTNKEEQEAVIEGRGGLGGERLVTYNIFLTDAFSGNATGEPFYVVGGESLDLKNDDSYRRSRRLLSNSTAEQRTEIEGINNLRENSLARQLEEKDDKIASIRLVRRLKPDELERNDPSEPRVPWVNLIPPNTKFFLENVQEIRQEKFQIIDTFGEWVAFFFGRRPEVYNYSGTLINSKNHDWKNEFQWNYDNFLRGSQAVKHRATMILQYDDVLVEGYMLNSNIQMAAAADKSVPFSFSMLVINRSPINPRRMIGLRTLRSGATEAEAALFQTLQQSLSENEFDTETFLLMREYFSGPYVPPAGKMTRRTKTNNIESETSTVRGQKGGIANDKPASQPFNSKFSTAVKDSGVDDFDLLPDIE